MARLERVVVLDATVLSNFAKIRRLNILDEAFPAGYVTTAIVVEELLVGIQAGKLPADLNYRAIPTVEFEDAEKALLAESHDLDPGEWSCLVVASQRGWVIATDDWAARKETIRLNVPVMGTLGALLALVRRGLLSLEEANRTLQDMLAAGYRAPVDRLDSLI